MKGRSDAPFFIAGYVQFDICSGCYYLSDKLATFVTSELKTNFLQ
jgi:hypothetical protein